MKETDDRKMYYFFDEAGSPEILGRKGINLVTNGSTSKIFIVGFIATEDPKSLNKAMKLIHEEIADDPYLSSVPSMKITVKRMQYRWKK